MEVKAICYELYRTAVEILTDSIASRNTLVSPKGLKLAAQVFEAAEL